MSLALPQQLHNLLGRTKRPIIVLKAEPTIDDYTAAFALHAFFSTVNKSSQIISEHGRLPSTLAFLPISIPIQNDFLHLHALNIHLDIRHTQVDELTYLTNDQELIITVLPKNGLWQEKNIRTVCQEYRYDLIIAIGTPDRASMGTLPTRYADFFLQTPIVVIDHEPKNEYFGAFNLVDLTASSVSEVCFDVLDKLDPSNITEHRATALLTGMMSKTKGFRASTVNAKTLETAQKLIERGAKREKIVEHLYRTRSVETLRLWGRALARLKSEESLNMVWTMVTRQDFVTAGATEEALTDVVDELLSTSPHSQIAILFFETAKNDICVQIHINNSIDALALSAPFSPTGTPHVALLTLKNSDIVAAEKTIITHVKEWLTKKQ